MLERKAYKMLEEWKSRDKHKCLVVEGQRQVGKTYLIRKFADDNYANSIYLEFNENKSAAKLFDGDFDVDEIIKGIVQYTGIDIVPRETLIILDEIQECTRARASLKYFTVDGRYDVIASGSLLGINLPSKNKKNSGSLDERALIPVGYEEHMRMYSMDFEEFLWAVGVTKKTTDDIRHQIKTGQPINEAVLAKFESHFRDFMIIGGMPESVQAFVDSKKYIESGRILRDIIKSCRDDIIRYSAESEKIKTLACFDAIPSQLARSNKKYMYSEIKGDRSRKAASTYSENLLWIGGAGYGNFCKALNNLSLPLESFESKDSFRVYLSDTGMLSHMYGNDTLNAIYNGDTGYNFGAIAENVVAENLMKCRYVPRYYRKDGGENRMEIDFVIALGKDISAIEVKSGKKIDFASLNKVSSVFDVGRKILFGKCNVGSDNGVEYYPLFASAFINELEPRRTGPEF